MYLNTEEASRISFLIQKRINNDLTPSEESELDTWVAKSPNNKKLYNRCLDNFNQKETFRYLQKIDSAKAWNEIKFELAKSQKDDKRNTIVRIVSYTAAACLLLFGTIALLNNWVQNIEQSELTTKVIDYRPANNQAILKLSNGKLITLDSNEHQVAVNSNSINYSNGDEITSTADITSAEINTPRGGYYKIILPDGTKAQLNAASSLSYPLTFKGNKREVWVSGEVYFEVKANKDQPFIVHSKNQEIEVLGTIFNVNAYDESSTIKTSLIEGIVQITNKLLKNTSPKLLKPNQQSIVNKDYTLVKQINPDSEIAWVNGKFNFDGKHLKEVMQEISRWYDIDVIIDDNVPNIEFFGGTFRNNNLSTILILLEQNDITYNLSENKKLFIKKNNLK